MAFGLGPMLFSLYASFTKYDIVNAPQWKGWSYNYGYIFQHDTFFPVAVRSELEAVKGGCIRPHSACPAT